MNNVDSIIIHCSDTPFGRDVRAKDIDAMHRQRGFKQIGYHYVICLDGTIEAGRPEYMEGAHCADKGQSGICYNKHSIGICYVGGRDKNGHYADTRTDAQKASMRELIQQLCRKYNIVELLGHRDTSPDLNGNGEIESNEWKKVCPCFDVRAEYANWLKPIIVNG